MNDLYTTLQTLCERRKSVREFADRPVSPDDIEHIKQIALMSPYASGRKNWEIVIVENRAVIRSLAEEVTRSAARLATRLREDFVEPYTAYSEHFTSFKSAPLLFVPCFRISPGLSYMLEETDDEILQWERDTYVKSISCVAMLILLAAESLGLGGCYMTGPLLAEKEIKKTLGIKQGKDIGAIIPVGYPLN